MKTLKSILMLAVVLMAMLKVVTAAMPPVLPELQKKMATVKTVYLEFTQERVLKLFSDPLKSEGVMLIERPDKIRWETTAPYQTVLIGDRNSVAQFEANDGKWEKLKLGFPQLLQHVLQQMAAMNQGNINVMLNDYDVTATTNTDIILACVPKDAGVRGMMSSLEIKLPPDLSATREVVLNEPNGDLTRITFTRTKYDATFPPKTFDQNKPIAIAEVRAAVNHGP